MTDDLCERGGRSDCRVWPEDGSPQRKSEHYGDAEFLDQQLRLLDLVPRQLFTWTVLTAVAVAAIVGLQFAYAWMAGRAAAGGPVLAALDVAAKGSLASWFSSLLLLGAVVAALLTYTVRRHRTDDYQGATASGFGPRPRACCWPPIRRPASARPSAR